MKVEKFRTGLDEQLGLVFECCGVEHPASFVEFAA